MNFVILGPPGAGKGTQAKMIAREFSLVHIAPGELLRNALNKGEKLGLKAKRYMEEGVLVPDEIIVDMISNRLSRNDCKKGFILDGFPRNVSQASALSKILKQLGYRLNAVFVIKVSVDEILKRLGGRRICKNCEKAFHIVYEPPKKEGICDVCGGKLYVRADDNLPSTIKERISIFESEISHVIDFYLNEQETVRHIDGDPDLNTVFLKLKKYIEEEIHSA